jgi:hypothetical protein
MFSSAKVRAFHEAPVAGFSSNVLLGSITTCFGPCRTIVLWLLKWCTAKVLEGFSKVHRFPQEERWWCLLEIDPLSVAVKRRWQHLIVAGWAAWRGISPSGYSVISEVFEFCGGLAPQVHSYSVPLPENQF